jgi:hypothetical protein
MKSYRCHKVVRAFRITGLQLATADTSETLGTDEVLLLPERVIVTSDWIKTRAHDRPCDGYFVQYEDGYTSWSPAAAFESGYSELVHEPAAAPKAANDGQ